MAADARVSVVITMSTRLGMTGLAGLGAILLARTLGKEGLGLFVLLRGLPSALILLTTLGVPGASPYLLNNCRFHPQRVLNSALTVGFAVGALDVLIWLGSASFLGGYFLEGLPLHWLRLAALAVPLQILVLVMVGFFQGLHQYSYANLLQILPEMGIFVSLFGLLAFGYLSISVLVPCILIGHLLAIVFGVSNVIRLGLRPVPAIDREVLRAGISFGLREQIGGAVQFFNLRVNHLILAALTNVGVVGVYAVATRASEMLRILPQAAGFVLAPRIASRSPQAAMSTVERLVAPVFLGNVALVIVAFLIGPTLIPLLFGEWSNEAVLPFRVLLVGASVAGANGVFAAFNHGQGRPQLTTYAVTVALGITISLDLLLIPKWGIVGAAWASSCAYAASAIALVLFFIAGNRHLSRTERGTNIPQ